MKKSSLYCLIGGACLITSTGLTLIANGIENANNNNVNTSETLVATTTLDTTPKTFAKNETVYIITDHSGHHTKSFVGSTINSSAEPIPVELHIAYTLNGVETTAEELAGKSGHVQITYSFAATKSYRDKLVPFLTVTGLSLDSHKFTHVKTTNGKIINETEDSTLVAGYAMVGLNENLGVDILPNTFSLEADVTDFSLDTAYTFATSEIFADLDTSKLNSVDELISQMNLLSSSMDQLASGAGQLASGLDSAANGVKALQSGLNTLTSGAYALANGTSDLASGAHQLESGAYQLKDGLGQIVDIDNQIIDKINEVTAAVDARYQTIAARIDRTINIIRYISPSTAEELANVKSDLESRVASFYDGVYGKVTTYTGGIESLYAGATELASGLSELSVGADSLADGASQLASGATELSLGSSTLAGGLSELAAGSHTLYNGLITFNEQGISKLTNFANNDLSNLVNNLRSSVDAARSYHHYQDPTANSVKFLFKTPAIK